ncbi:MAG: phospholipase D-like domain-containing protein [Helicobacteraceae bacterium]|jgi:phosphatidylserine/phosphatidylglycerophosphate/cardiolipin synthase-like enzyme|nr:phospholipase D-like domain-containing protein [Helicobacteraceae bacterium]
MKNLIFAYLIAFCLAAEAFGERIYFVLPKEGERAEKQIELEINKAESEIYLAIYSFTNNTLAKALKRAASRGVKIYLVTDEKNLRGNMRDSKAGELAKIEGVSVKIARGEQAKSGEYYGIMHHKIASIDGERAIYGSANWTASAFNVNNELVFIDRDPDLAAEFEEIIKEILKNAKDYVSGE